MPHIERPRAGQIAWYALIGGWCETCSVRKATRMRSASPSPSPSPDTLPDVRPKLRFDTCAARLDSTSPPAPAELPSPVEGDAPIDGLATFDFGSGVARAVAKSNIEDARFEVLLFPDLFDLKDSTLSSFGPPLPKMDEAFAEGAGEVVCSRWMGGWSGSEG